MKQKPIWIIILVIINSCAGAKKISNEEILSNLEIIDISERQLELFNKYKEASKDKRDKIFLDSIFRLNTYLWEGYLGDEKEFIEWVDNTAIPELENFNQKANKIDLEKMNDYFNQTTIEMTNFVGYHPKGKWYIFWGPGWTNLGGFGDGTMLIDLASRYNQKLTDITEAFPHEINHQIYNHTIPVNTPYTVISRVVDEGFACYVSHKFNKGKTSIAQDLSYSDAEYEFCLKNEKEIFELIRKNYLSKNEDEIEDLADRGYEIKEGYPGAIGYFIGFRIIEEYVKKNGQKSWKEIYKLSPEVVLEESGILN